MALPNLGVSFELSSPYMSKLSSIDSRFDLKIAPTALASPEPLEPSLRIEASPLQGLVPLFTLIFSTPWLGSLPKRARFPLTKPISGSRLRSCKSFSIFPTFKISP